MINTRQDPGIVFISTILVKTTSCLYCIVHEVEQMNQTMTRLEATDMCMYMQIPVYVWPVLISEQTRSISCCKQDPSAYLPVQRPFIACT